MRSVSDKFVEKIKVGILCVITFFQESHAVYVIMWTNIVQPDRPQMTTWRMRIARWILKGKNTHSEYVMLIALTLQQ